MEQLVPVAPFDPQVSREMSVQSEETKEPDHAYGHGVEHTVSTDARSVMITRPNVKKLTPALQAPQVTRCPSLAQFRLFDLSNDAHVAQLCQRLELIEQNRDAREPRALRQRTGAAARAHACTSSDNSAILFISPEEDSASSAEARTPNQTAGPSSRQELADQLDPVLLAIRLADIPIVGTTMLPPMASDPSRYNSIESPGGLPHPHSGNFVNPGPVSGEHSAESSTPHSSYGQSHLATPILKQAPPHGGSRDLQSPKTQLGLIAKLNEIKEQLDSDSSSDTGLRAEGEEGGDVPLRLTDGRKSHQ